MVKDARASFEKASDHLTDKDIKLIHYLVKHEHASPFRGTAFKFKVKAPLYICRQWWKHVIASSQPHPLELGLKQIQRDSHLFTNLLQPLRGTFAKRVVQKAHKDSPW